MRLAVDEVLKLSFVPLCPRKYSRPAFLRGPMLFSSSELVPPGTSPAQTRSQHPSPYPRIDFHSTAGSRTPSRALTPEARGVTATHVLLCFLPMGVLDLQLENTARKRERTTSDPRATEQKQEKKRLKISKKPRDPDPPEKDFTPYDYSKSDFKAFAGEARSGALSGLSSHARWKAGG